MKTLDIESGERIILDPEDYVWISKRKWRTIKTRNTKVLVVSSKNTKRKLYRLLDIKNNHQKNGQIYFLNGDRLDYRKKNLLIVYSQYPPKDEKPQKPFNKSKETIVHIQQNSCSIKPAKQRIDYILCATCYYTQRDKYLNCLNEAAKRDWPGWKHHSGCEFLKQNVKKNIKHISLNIRQHFFIPALSYLILRNNNYDITNELSCLS